MIRPPLPSEDTTTSKPNTAATFDMLDSLMDSITDEIDQIQIETTTPPPHTPRHPTPTPVQQPPRRAAPVPAPTPAPPSISLESLLQSSPRLTGFLSRVTVGEWADVFLILSADAVLYAFSSEDLAQAPIDAMKVANCRGHYDSASNTWLLTLSSSSNTSTASPEWTFQCQNKDAYQQWLDGFRKALPPSRQVKRPERLVTAAISPTHLHHPQQYHHERNGSFSSQTTADSYPSPSPISSPRPHGLQSPGGGDSGNLSERERGGLQYVSRQESRSRSRPRPPRSASVSDENASVSRQGTAVLRSGSRRVHHAVAVAAAPAHHVHFQEAVADDAGVQMYRQYSANGRRFEGDNAYSEQGMYSGNSHVHADLSPVSPYNPFGRQYT
ncbi:hypothetical protein BJ741DRAFT_622070 [Chytriomyces cf. hyalinus JEL632]|nr:hypothetical protein BJ741DRAFT_622070 [Chytriomyces cf. hyalinus JEL632]